MTSGAAGGEGENRVAQEQKCSGGVTEPEKWILLSARQRVTAGL